MPSGPEACEAVDREQAELLARGDERAFGALYRRHNPALYLLALRLAGGERADAEDIVHDAWVRAVERLAAFEWRSSLRTWLSGFVVHRAHEILRERHRMAPLQEDASLPAEDGRLTGTVDRIALERAIAAFAPGYRMVLLLHDLEGNTHEEIGRQLGIEPGTSKSQLSRARRELRRTGPHACR